MLGLIAASHEVETRLETALEPLGLSLAKFGVLSRLLEAGEPLPLGALADRLACVRSNITSLIDRLEADRLVARLADAQDRRSTQAQLTPNGRARYQAGQKTLQTAARDALAPLPRGQREALGKLMRMLRREP